MTPPADPGLYKRHRYPTEIISHAIWRYFRFTLSYRAVEELWAACGITVTYETVRQWCRKFGQIYANQRRRRRPQPGDKGHMDEVFLKINGAIGYLWRAVDQQGNVLDILVTSKRDQHAAKRCFRQLRKGCRTVPRVMITDKLKSYGAAQREILPGVEHRPPKGWNNRAENSHQPTPQKARPMRGFKSAGHAQRLRSAVEPIRGHFRLSQHNRPAGEYRAQREPRCQSWNEVTGAPMAA